MKRGSGSDCHVKGRYDADFHGHPRQDREVAAADHVDQYDAEERRGSSESGCAPPP